jgi:hypothetical protein
MEVADKTTKNSRDKATEQLTTGLLLVSAGSKPTDSATDKVASSL